MSHWNKSTHVSSRNHRTCDSFLLVQALKRFFFPAWRDITAIAYFATRRVISRLSLYVSLSYRHIVQIPLYALQVLHIRHRTLTFVNYQRVIKVHRKSDEHYEDGNDYYGAGSGSGEGVVPEFNPAENSHLDEEEKQTQYRGKGPSQFDESAHSLVRRLRYETRDLKFTYGLDIR